MVTSFASVNANTAKVLKFELLFDGQSRGSVTAEFEQARPR